MLGLMSGDRVKTTSTGAVPLDTLVHSGVRQAPDVDALATRALRQASILVWNYHDVNAPAPPISTSVIVRGIPDGIDRVLVTQYRIDDTHSNAYTVWQKMDSPQHPNEQQYAQLKAAGQLQLLDSPAWLDVHDGMLALSNEIPRQGITLLQLSW
jgi:xylan 1,4-beta-xylosidase